MESSSAARFTSKMGMLALAAILVFGSASMAAAQGNGNGGNPLDALWAAIEEIQVQIDSLATGNTDLLALIDAEAAARMAADSTLQSQIDLIEPGIVKGFYQTAPSSQTVGPGGVAFFGGIKQCTNADDKAINVSITGSTLDDVFAGHIVLANGPSGNGWFMLIRNAESESAEFTIRLLCADIT